MWRNGFGPLCIRIVGHILYAVGIARQAPATSTQSKAYSWNTTGTKTAQLEFSSWAISMCIPFDGLGTPRRKVSKDDAFLTSRISWGYGNL